MPFAHDPARALMVREVPLSDALDRLRTGVVLTLFTGCAHLYAISTPDRVLRFDPPVPEHLIGSATPWPDLYLIGDSEIVAIYGPGCERPSMLQCAAETLYEAGRTKVGCQIYRLAGVQYGSNTETASGISQHVGPVFECLREGDRTNLINDRYRNCRCEVRFYGEDDLVTPPPIPP